VKRTGEGSGTKQSIKIRTQELFRTRIDLVLMEYYVVKYNTRWNGSSAVYNSSAGMVRRQLVIQSLQIRNIDK
jgi:hypothetical protein